MKKILIIAFVLISQLGFSQNYNYFWNYPAFSTPSVVLSSVTLKELTCSFDAHVIIESDGALDVTERGIVYSSSTAPTTANTKVTSGTGSGEFIQNCGYGSYSSTIYVRAYIINKFGTYYSNEISTNVTVPVFITLNVGNITSTSADIYGEAHLYSGSGVTTIKIYTGLTFSGLSLYSTIYTNSNGYFSATVSGLTPSTKYYYNADGYYCASGGGTGTSDFTTSAPATTCPPVNTTGNSAPTPSTFYVYGDVLSDGGNSPVTERGVVYNTTGSPTTSDNKVTGGSGTGTFSAFCSELNELTTYYVRAYAINGTGTCYGAQLIVRTTGSCVPATVSTDTPSAITNHGATVGGNATATGGCSITEKGIVMSGSSSVSYSNYVYKTSNGTGTGTFSVSYSTLSASTTYYVKAYAVTIIDGVTTIAYGSLLNFTTNATINIPVVTTTTASSITGSSATSGGNVSSDGGATVIARGIVWDTYPNQPTIELGQYDGITSNGTGTGSFTSAIISLTAGVTYTYRAYATNSEGTAYGYVYSFTALSTPTLTTYSAAFIEGTNASVAASVDTGAPVTGYGVCWSTSPNPTIANSHTNAGSCACVPPNNYTVASITGLTGNTLYYARAWATNSVGTGYGNQVNFTTLDVSLLPTVIISSVTSVGDYSAIGNSIVTSEGSMNVTQKGVCWNTSPTIDPTTSDMKTTDGTGLGSFTSSISPLLCGTTYYVRAYATNGVGTAYSSTASKITITTTGTPYYLVNNVMSRGITSTLPYTNTDIIYWIFNGAALNLGQGWNGACGSWKNLVITSFNSDYDANGLTPFTLKYNGSTVTLPLTIDVSSLVYGSNTGLTVTGTLNSAYPIQETCRISYYITNTTGTAGSAATETHALYQAPTAPVVSTSAATLVTQTSASVTATVNSGAPVTAYGVCWGTSVNPTITPNSTNLGACTCVFPNNFGSVSITGLTGGVTYHARAYATNGVGTSYGNDITFTTTSPAVLPTVTISATTNILANTAVGHGEVTAVGSYPVTERGICWSTSSTPTIANNRTVDGTGLGVFTSNISSLLCNTTYYVRTYARSSAGDAYSSTTLNFTTTSTPSYSSGSMSRSISAALPVTNTDSIYWISNGAKLNVGRLWSDACGSWKNLVITSFNSDYDGNGLTLFTLKHNGSTATLPLTIDISALTSGSYTGLSITGTLNSYFPTQEKCRVTYYVTNTLNVSGASTYTDHILYKNTNPVAGDSYGGGTIAYVLQSGDVGYVSGEFHGIVVAPSDQSSGIVWGTTTANVSTVNTMLQGAQNTANIISVNGAGSYAAKLCSDLTIGAYSDWILPSYDDLIAIYSSKSVLSGFTTGNYWTSTQYISQSYAYIIHWGTGVHGWAAKDSPLIKLRAIRYF